jgi:hypothetical protein
MGRHTYTLTGAENFLVFSGIVVLMWFLLWQVPKFRRSGEQGKSLASYRVVASFGGPFLNASGSFYRITLYDKFFFAVLFGCEKIHYADARNLQLNLGGIPSISLNANGAKIRLYSELGRLQELHKELAERIRPI